MANTPAISARLNSYPPAELHSPFLKCTVRMAVIMVPISEAAALHHLGRAIQARAVKPAEQLLAAAADEQSSDHAAGQWTSQHSCLLTISFCTGVLRVPGAANRSVQKMSIHR